MKCTIKGCPGEYEPREIVHIEQWRGNPVVIAHVPAEVCPICGDTLLAPDTIRHLESLRQAPPVPTGAVPLYDYAEATMSLPSAARVG